MATADVTCAFRSLLADMATVGPRNGFQPPSDVSLTPAQVGVVCNYEPDSILDGVLDVLPAIADRLDAASRSIDGKVALADIVIAALTAAAQRVAVREAAAYCDEAAMAAADDHAYDAGRSGASIRGYAYGAGVSVPAAL